MASKFKLPSEIYQDIVSIEGLSYIDIVNIFALAGFIQLTSNVQNEYSFILIDRYTKPNPNNPEYTIQLTDVYDIQLTLYHDSNDIYSVLWQVKSTLRD